MNIKKGIIAGAMIAAIGMTTITGVYAKDNTQVKGENEIAICTVGSEEEFTFKELSKEFKDNISKADYKKAEALFNKATKLGEDASKFYNELYNLDLFENELVEEISFKDFAKDFKKDVKSEVKKKAETLYNKAIKLDKEGKYDEASKVWDELFEMDLFEGMGVISTIDGDEGLEFDVIDMNDIDMNDMDVMDADMIIENIKPMTFDEFSKDFKKGVTSEVFEKAKDLYNKAVKADEESQKAWNELYKMDIFKPMDSINMDFDEDFSKMDWQ